MYGGGNIGIAHHFKRSAEGYLNKIERRFDEKRGYYIRKKFDNGFLANLYSDFLIILEAIPHSLKPRSNKGRKRTKAKKYKKFNSRGFPVPRFLEEGYGFLDIGYIEMKELSRLLRDNNVCKQKKLEFIRIAAAEIRKIHDAGFELGDANVHNIGFTPKKRFNVCQKRSI